MPINPKSFLKRIREGVEKTGGSVLSAPSRAKSAIKTRKATVGLLFPSKLKRRLMRKLPEGIVGGEHFNIISRRISEHLKRGDFKGAREFARAQEKKVAEQSK
jgi:hypothetical protein|tara:strand:- start:755 stop:1063 length:309 start_codon:yes stop_codon:yes gene_type:complete